MRRPIFVVLTSAQGHASLKNSGWRNAGDLGEDWRRYGRPSLPTSATLISILEQPSYFHAECYGQLFQIVERYVAGLAFNMRYERSVKPTMFGEILLRPASFCAKAA